MGGSTFDGEGLLDLWCMSALHIGERMRRGPYLLRVVGFVGVDSVERHFDFAQ
jgi:hypothetical protein